MFKKIFKFTITLALLVSFVGTSYAATPEQELAIAEANARVERILDSIATAEASGADTSALDAELEAASLQLELAQNAAASGASSNNQINKSDIIQSIAKTAQLVDNVFDPLIHYFTFNIGNFLGNDYIFGAEMGQMLKSIWVVTRNIVNIAFALILLFLAVKYIFSEDEGTDLKKLLPKFVILMILVNFSWLGSRVILDAANVTTNIVFSIPSGVKGTMGEALSQKFTQSECKIIDNRPGVGCAPGATFYPGGAEKTLHKICTTSEVEELKKQYAEAYPEGQDPDDSKAKFGWATFCYSQMDISKFNQNTASYYLSYSMAQVQKLPMSNAGAGDITKIAFSSLLSLIIQLVYLIAFIALYVALIFRVAMLWLLVAFSPAMILLYFIKDLQIPTGGVDERFSLQSFVSLAFAPAAVGAVWSVAFIMIITGQTVGKEFFVNVNKGGEIVGHEYASQVLFAGMDNIQEFIWLLITIGVIWMGTFAVLGKMPVVGSLFQTVQSYGTGAAKWLATRPKIAPIIPLYDYNTKEMSLSSVGGKFDKDKFNNDSYLNTVRMDNMRRNFNRDVDNEKIKVDVNFENKGDKAYRDFKALTKVNDNDIVKNEQEIRNMITSSNITTVNKNKYADYIINQAKAKVGTGGQPAPTDTVPTPTPATQGQPEPGKKEGQAGSKPEVSAKTSEKADEAKEASAPAKADEDTGGE